jgi:predicted transcriptional regulator
MGRKYDIRGTGGLILALTHTISMRRTDDDPIDVEYPSTLRVEIGSTEDMFTDAVAAAETFENDSRQDEEAAEAVVTYDSIEQLRDALTTERIELLESLMATPAGNHSQLATRLNRSSARVRADVDVLVKAGLVLRQEGPPNLTVPYDHIAIEYSIQADPSAE